MSHETSASYADCVELEFVAEHCPEQNKAFMDYIAKCGSTMENVAFWLDDYMGMDGADDLEEEQEAEIRNLYELLQKEFERVTKLTLEIRYHDSNDRGDEVDGGFWAVGGVWVLSEAARKVKEQIERRFWTDGG